MSKKMPKKPRRSWLIVAVLILFILATIAVFVPPAHAQTPANETTATFTSIESAQEWLASKNHAPSTPLQSLNAVNISNAGCQAETITRNPNHNYPLTQNTSEVIQFVSSWCTNTNTDYLTVGADWWGVNQSEAELWGMIVIRDANTNVLIVVHAFDIKGTPDVDLQALQTSFSRQFELGRGSVRIEWEANIQMTGQTTPATKTQSTVIYPNSGTVTLVKSGAAIGATIELIDITNQNSPALVSRVKITAGDIDPTTKTATISFKNLAGPISATTPNYLLQERVDLLTAGLVPTNPSTGEAVFPTWKISLDSSQQNYETSLYNKSAFKLYLPCIMGGGGTPVLNCPVQGISLYLNGQLVRLDHFTLEGKMMGFPTLHPNETIVVDLTEILAAGYTPNLVQLWLDNKPYATYSNTAGKYTFTTSVGGYDEYHYKLGAYRMYIFHMQIWIEDHWCLYQIMWYIDP